MSGKSGPDRQHGGGDRDGRSAERLPTPRRSPLPVPGRAGGPDRWPGRHPERGRGIRTWPGRSMTA